MGLKGACSSCKLRTAIPLACHSYYTTEARKLRNIHSLLRRHITVARPPALLSSQQPQPWQESPRQQSQSRRPLHNVLAKRRPLTAMLLSHRYASLALHHLHILQPLNPLATNTNLNHDMVPSVATTCLEAKLRCLMVCKFGGPMQCLNCQNKTLGNTSLHVTMWR